VPGRDSVVSGGAAGADRIGARVARELGIAVTEHLPDWNAHGRRAGFVRNAAIVADCDRVVAFWDGVSRGTANTIDQARAAGKPVRVFRPQDRRLPLIRPHQRTNDNV
jgi:hypothetical protein